MLCEAGARLTVGALRVQVEVTFSVVATAVEVTVEWSGLAAATEELSVPVVLPDTA
jgi:hypothetical protein